LDSLAVPVCDNAEKAVRPGVPRSLEGWPGDLGCVFCNLLASVDHAIANGMAADEAEKAAGLVFRGVECFVCLNAYPYTSGHVMVIPHKHEASLAALPQETAHELMDLAQKTERVLTALFAAWDQFWDESGAGGWGGRGWASASACFAALDWGYQFHDNRGETRVMPEDAGYYLGADAGGVCGIAAS
jgi:ATP adenylyltransferase